ncbi:HU family DNA-binding protein [Cellvibrio japonicus]|uniref:Viral histone-like protein n=1 Tax=Cellvibrio japonicus (strain Ueda107) TaxID=498211 RepID=B3PKJ7_CELJU|nr:HU family DNA-binding protein [Cellvibrio japonicus]ACE85027.1 DNA-binding protein HU family [Cellvibrio japonicus Ueda107]QEI12859.1 integration host factor [Cellvibrio japonicus]QEI16433.1 integration host factor [Cellvibrio japonicus]QEI20011.1 integration host factor [Cellvibrio japonicus]
MAIKKAPAAAPKAAAKKAPAAKAAPAKAAPAKKAPAAKAAAPVKKVPAKAAPAVVKPIAERQNKSQIVQQIVDATELSKKQVQAVLDELSNVIEGHIKKKGVGEFVLPGLLKITTVKKPATKARKGINPFTGEEVTFKAKPASTSVKVRALKKLKEMAL